MWGIKLIDKNGEMVCDENWFEYNYNQEWKNYEVESNMRIVGFYGDMNDEVITGLGFILSKSWGYKS